MLGANLGLHLYGEVSVMSIGWRKESLFKWSSHMTNMAVMHIYGKKKNLKNLLLGNQMADDLET